MTERTVTQPTPDGPMALFTASPEAASGSALPGVIVLQEAFGVNEHVRGVACRFAAAGYVAAAPELFHRAGAGIEFGYTDWERIKPLFAGITRANLATDLRAARAFLADHPGVDPSRIFVFGECLGGYASVLASIELDLVGAIGFYPGGLNRARPGIGFGPLLEDFGSIKCPLLLVYGGKDAGIPPEDVAQVRATLEALGKPHQVHVMPEGGHGFCCEARSAYHAASAEAAWALAFGWIGARLGP